jgi:hypothetical protein
MLRYYTEIDTPIVGQPFPAWPGPAHH